MKRTILIVYAALVATPAFAHLPPGEYGSFAAGFSHPLFGLDHILAMVAVGLWAGTLGGRAIWAVPLAFVGTMSFGFVLALTGLHLPLVEPMIMASVVVLGLLIAFAVRLEVILGAIVVGAFAMFHGYAHGGELGTAGALQFGLGFALATALLHAIGIGLGLGVGRLAATGSRFADVITRSIGGATATLGLVLLVG
ncbi:HupE/UreJ family protein [Acuticoccus sediminis]|uniref:HupE/UreJ family protein n=1 Tax=Acuticoccus sediminis TaxID=2184697 RepID=UPI001CFC4B85|nr:HupE/UreJ family protein [Acuticoccus sediminis]